MVDAWERRGNVQPHSDLVLGQARSAVKAMTKPAGNTVFVVDDDGSMLQSIGRLLRQHGFEAILFNSAEAFERHGNIERALCVVLDINLSDGSGIDLRRSLGVPNVVFMTGNDRHETRMAAIEVGCIAYLTKPFSAKSLIDAIHRAAALAPRGHWGDGPQLAD
jgi:FixJ family two-component response regulator